MTKQEQIEEMKKIMIKTCLGMRTVQEDYAQNNYAQALYNAGYRKVFLNKDNFTDLLNEEIKELSLIERTRKETAKEIFQRVINICIKEEDFQDGTVNTQLEPLYFGIMNGCAFVRGEVKELAKQYGVEVEE